ncbi:MAG: RHS repeat-associated core domain-containing protein [Pseudomonadota bacterium]
MLRNRFCLFLFLMALVSGWGLFAGCGGGGDGTSTFGSRSRGLMSGSVGLGPISGGEVIVKTLSGTRIGSGTTMEFDPAVDTFMSEGKIFLNNKEDRRVGKFNVGNLVRTGLSDDDIVIVKVSGGQDVDPNDDGFISENEGMNGPLLGGDIYAVVKLSDLIRGNVVVNVFTTLSFAGLQGNLDPDEVKARLDRFARYIFRDLNATVFNGDLNSDGVVDMFDIYYYDPTNHNFQGTESSRIHDPCLRGQHFIDCLIPNSEAQPDTFIEALLNGAGADFIEDYMAAARGYGDADGDGLSNIFEDPAVHDTDGDGMFDADPLEIDMDDDGIPDDDEFRYGLNPWVDDASEDTDRDGINNIKEIDNGLNPVDGSDGATADSDGDGLSNAFEIETGTNPKNSAPQPFNTAIPLSVDQNTNGGVIINASDPEGDVIGYVISGASAHGTESIDASGYLTYEPFADYHGSDTLTVELNDSANGGIVTVRVDVAVNEITPQPPALNVTASPEIIQIGGSAAVTWSATHADLCFIEPGIGIVDIRGSIHVAPERTTTYSITATGPGGTSIAYVTVAVNYPVPTVNISARPMNILPRETSTLYWASTNADSCFIEPGIGSVDVNSSIIVSPTETTTYTITVTGLGGTDTADVTVTYSEVRVNISADPKSILPGEISTLTWSSNDADSCVIEPGIGRVDLNGSIQVSPAESTIYTITATGPLGTTTASTIVNVMDTSTLPTVDILADPETILAGELSTLRWNSTHADSCVIEPGIGIVDVNGSVQVLPTETTTYNITATGSGGIGKSEVTVTLVVSGQPLIYITDPVNMATVDVDAITVSGTVNNDYVNIWVNGIAACVSNGVFMAENVPLQPGANRIIATASIIGTGVTGSDKIHVVREYEYQPQPENSFGEQYEDLMPSDALVAEYDSKRFSVITGFVRAIDNSPIEDVSITIHDHPEYGTATTDLEGSFSIPVEGGKTFIAVYQKDGLISVHRKVYVPWNDISISETIQMISEDPASTTLTFDGNPDTVVTHKSTEVSDEFGHRSCSMVITGDNKAYSVDEKGQVLEELTTITTRATEFTTPELMPAKLPPTSAYTYCAELSVDGTQRVKFEKPVITYVDNFLGFDVGEIVPVGYYDRDRGVWVPSDNGVVVKLLDTDTDGIVDALDVDGDDLPDDLNGDGFFNDEAMGLNDALRYPQGSTFWRVAVTHFSPIDSNWPYGLLPDAVPPNSQEVPNTDQQKKDDPQRHICSYVEERSRIFHEDIPIPGTDMALHYASNRVDGYKNVINVPASGESVPDSLKRIVVDVEIAGRTLKQTLDPLPNQKAEFIWDGLDHLGRPVIGTTTAKVSLGFVYDTFYYTPGYFAQAFGQAGIDPTSIPTRGESILWKYNTLSIDMTKERGRGSIADGWTLSSHHFLNQMDTSTLYKGGGSIAKKNSLIIDTIVGNGEPGFSGDGGLAIQATLYLPLGLDFDAAGNLYIADSYNNIIRKVDTSGIIATVAGNGTSGYSGDGGPATEAQFYSPNSVTVDASGNIYIADVHNHSIRKVDANGIITTVAGNGTNGYSGDGGPATEAQFYYPNSVAVDYSGNIYIASRSHVRKVDTNGIITTVAGNDTSGYIGDGGPATEATIHYAEGVAVDASGNLFIADYANNRIRKVDASGIITTVAGNGTRGYSGDGGPATEAQLYYPSSVTVDYSGNIYITSNGDSRIRKLDTNGIITTVAGDGLYDYNGDGGPATEAQISMARDVAIDASGNIYIADTSNHRIRKVAVPAVFDQFVAAGDITFTEENGLGHIMSGAGLHLRTIDLATGVVLREFGYDQDDNLISLNDQFGNQITIQRDASGVPISIISPDGITTSLKIDANNHLTRITYPDGSYYDFEYTAEGLSTAKTDSEGNRFEHVFTDNGRISDFTDDEGGFWQFSRNAYENGDILSEVLTGEGNLTSYLDHTFSTGAYTSTITNPTGAETIFIQSADGLTVNQTLPCGKALKYHYGLDPQYTFKFVKEITEREPSSLEKVVLRDKAYQDTDSDNIPDLITETVSVNGKTTSVENDILQSRKVFTSPEGRMVTTLYDPETLLTQSVSVAGLFETTYEYDSRGRLTSTDTNARQALFTYNAQGFVETITDAEGFITAYIYDEVGRLKRVDRPDGSSVEFTYDLNGNMTVLTNPSGVDHGFGYSSVNQRNIYQAPVSGNYQYTYDKDRRLIQTRFPSGRKINNIYENGRLKQVQAPEGNIDYTYFCGTTVASIVNGSETISYAYDGSLVTSEGLTGAVNQIFEYTYNSDFDLSEITYAGGTTVYSYDDDGLLIGAGGFSINRNADNGLPETVTGGTLNIARTFNGHGEMEEQGFTVGGSHVLSWNLSRDNAGKITAKSETATGVTSGYQYSYDALGRLLAVYKDGILVEEYEYGLNGVRTYEMNLLRGIAGRTLSYSDEDHLLNAGDAQYQYDVDGFLVSRTGEGDVTTYDYSSLGELLEVTLSGGTHIGYTHDPLGRRIAKKINGVTVEKYLWQGLTRLLAVYDGGDNLTMRFEYADGRMPAAMKKEGSTYYLTYDPVGSLRIVADSSGNVVKRIEYDSFGNIIADTDPSFKVPFGFAGGLHDRDTGLIRFGYRDYDPDTGRWTAKDPIFFAGGDTDLYGYCLNNPISLTDPLGLEFSDILPGIKKAIVEGYKGSTYAVSETTTSIVDIAMNGHPLAKTALGIAFISESVPLAGAVGIYGSPFIISAAYNAAPYSEAIVDFTFGWFTSIGPPSGWGYLSSGTKYLYEMIRDIISQPRSTPCEDK